MEHFINVSVEEIPKEFFERFLKNSLKKKTLKEYLSMFWRNENHFLNKLLRKYFNFFELSLTKFPANLRGNTWRKFWQTQERNPRGIFWSDCWRKIPNKSIEDFFNNPWKNFLKNSWKFWGKLQTYFRRNICNM